MTRATKRLQPSHVHRWAVGSFSNWILTLAIGKILYRLANWVQMERLGGNGLLLLQLYFWIIIEQQKVRYLVNWEGGLMCSRCNSSTYSSGLPDIHLLLYYSSVSMASSSALTRSISTFSVDTAQFITLSLLWFSHEIILEPNKLKKSWEDQAKFLRVDSRVGRSSSRNTAVMMGIEPGSRRLIIIPMCTKGSHQVCFYWEALPMGGCASLRFSRWK